MYMQDSKRELNRHDRDFLYLLCCAVNDLQPDLKRIGPMNPEIIMNMADQHGVSAMTAGVLIRSGVKSSFRGEWKQSIDQAQRAAVLFAFERSAIEDYCERNEIRYMFLKGHLFQQYYPVYGMREMADIDILTDASGCGLLRQFLIDRGYTLENTDESNHDTYHKPPLLNIEVHSRLFRRELEPGFAEYYQNVFDRLLPVSGKKQGCCFSREDFYIYHILHAVKHLHYGGIGVKALTDTCLFRRKEKDLDLQYIKRELRKLAADTEEGLLAKIAEKVLSPDAALNGFDLTEEETACLLNIIDAGAYGTVTNYIRTQMGDDRDGKKLSPGTKAGYLWQRLYPGQDSYKDRYPFFYRHKWAYPLFPAYRLIRAIRKDKGKSIADEIKGLMKLK